MITKSALEFMNCKDFNIGDKISVNVPLFMISTIFLTVIIILFFVYDKVIEKYISEILLELSKMLNSIIELKNKEYFPITDDTILAKLQMQVIKLSKILKSQNARIEKEKNEIQHLISDICHQLI